MNNVCKIEIERRLWRKRETDKITDDDDDGCEMKNEKQTGSRKQDNN